MINHYDPSEIPFIWDQVEDDISRALKRGSVYTIEMIYDGLRSGALQLFTARDVTLVASYLKEYCLLLALSGKNMRSWLSLLPLIEDSARLSGCGKMRIQGRKGWARLLGYEITGRDELNLHIIEKKL